MWSLGRVYAERGESAGHATGLRATQAPPGTGRRRESDAQSRPPRAGRGRGAPTCTWGPGAAGPSPSAARSCSLRSGGRRLRGLARGPGSGGGGLGPAPVLRVPARPASEDTCVTRRTPAPLRLKVYFWGSRCTPKGSLRTPRAREASEPGDRPLPAQLSPPPAGSFHFLTAKSPRGAPLPPPPRRPRTPPRAASLPAPAHPGPAHAGSFCPRLARASGSSGSSPPLAAPSCQSNDCPPLPPPSCKAALPLEEPGRWGRAGSAGPAAYGQSQRPNAGREAGGGEGRTEAGRGGEHLAGAAACVRGASSRPLPSPSPGRSPPPRPPSPPSPAGGSALAPSLAPSLCLAGCGRRWAAAMGSR